MFFNKLEKTSNLADERGENVKKEKENSELDSSIESINLINTAKTDSINDSTPFPFADNNNKSTSTGKEITTSNTFDNSSLNSNYNDSSASSSYSSSANNNNNINDDNSLNRTSNLSTTDDSSILQLDSTVVDEIQTIQSLENVTNSIPSTNEDHKGKNFNIFQKT